MDSNLQKVLEQRQKDSECIICGKPITEKMLNNNETIYLAHFLFGRVEVCCKHIKQSGNSE